MKRLKRLFVTIVMGGIALACAPGASAQGSRKDDVVFNAQGRPMAGATVRVCTSGATGQPCSPLASIYSDPGLTQALANPTSSDGLGNYTFYAAPGRYEIEISGPGITTKQLPNVILPNDPATPTFTTVTTTSGITAFSLTLSGNLTVSGSTAVTGSLTVGGSAVATTGTENQWTASQHFKGPNPWRDFTAYMKDPNTGFPVNCARTNTNSPQATGTISSGSASLTLNQAGDYKNGCGIAVLHAGPTSNLAAPGLTATVSTASRSGSATVTIVTSTNHGLVTGSPGGEGEGIVVSGCSIGAYNGTFPVQTVANSTTFTYTAGSSATDSATGCSYVTEWGYAHGTTGSTTYNYQIVAIDQNMGTSAASASFAVTSGNSTLTPNNYNWLTWAFESNAVMFAVYSDGGTGGAKTCVGIAFRNAFIDVGTSVTCPAFLPTNPPGAATAQTLNTTISSGGGTTTLVLAAAASNTATSQNTYDDESSFLASCVNDVIADQTLVSKNAAAFGCYIPPTGPWDFNGPLPTATVANTSNGAVRIKIAGTVHLSTMPWQILKPSYAIEASAAMRAGPPVITTRKQGFGPTQACQRCSRSARTMRLRRGRIASRSLGSEPMPARRSVFG